MSAYAYQPPMDAVLTGLKFQRLDYLGSQLGERLADCFGEALREAEVIVPIPLHWWRFLARGYNQASEIGRALARRLDIPMCDALTRRRGTRAQSQLSRAERQRNLRDAFTLRRPRAVQGRRIVLVDDVFTTGSTLKGAAAQLRGAGAESIIAVVAAQTPAGGELPAQRH